MIYNKICITQPRETRYERLPLFVFWTVSCIFVNLKSDKINFFPSFDFKPRRLCREFQSAPTSRLTVLKE